MLVYGLTGGIGAGKSTVAALLGEAGVEVFDADTVGHELIEPGNRCHAAIAERFPDCVRDDGRLDRKLLAARVFSEPLQRRWLEDLLHPAIRDEIDSRMDARRPVSGLCAIEGAVLLESRVDFRLAGLIVVRAPIGLRLERLSRRDGRTAAEIRARLTAQLPEWAKMTRASHLIDNGADRASTRLAVRQLASQLMEEAGGALPCRTTRSGGTR